MCAVLAALWWLLPPAAAAVSYGGAPAIRHYLPAEYGGSDQIFGLAQTANGEILLADVNDRVIWRSDGQRWRPIALDEEPLVLAIGRAPGSEQERIWVGAAGDLGYLEPMPGASRQMRFVSLRSEVPPGPCAENDRYDDIAVTPAGVFFGQNSALLRWDGAGFRCWTPPDGEGFGWSHAVDGRLLVGARSGQWELVDDELVALEEWGPAASEIDALPDGRFLVLRHGERAVEIFDPRDGTFEARQGMLHDLLQEFFVQKALPLADGRIAVSLGRGGLALVGRDGRLEQRLGAENGLPGGEAYRLLVDREGLLWVSVGRGVAVIDLSSPFEMFPPSTSISGYLTDVRRFDGFLFATTFDGVFWFDESVAEGAAGEGPGAGFRQLGGDLEEGADTWSLEVLGDGQLYVVSDTGVARVERDRTQTWRARAVGARGPLWIGQLADAERVLAVGNQRLQVMATDAEPWPIVFRLDLPTYAAAAVAETKTRFWILGDGQLRIADFPAAGDYDEPPRLQIFRDEVEWYGLDRIGGQLTAWGSEGVFVLHDKNDSSLPESWRRDPRFSGLDLARLMAHPTGYDVEDDLEGGAWVSTLYGFERWVPPPGASSAEPRERPSEPLQRRAGVGMWGQRLGATVADPDVPGVVWFERDGVISRFDATRVAASKPRPRPPLISRSLPREVRAGREQAAASPAGRTAGAERAVPVDTVPFSRDTVRFEYSSPRFMNPERTEYRVLLEGFDDGWQEWNRETRKDYTQLREGHYVFRVEARVADDLLGESSYELHVLPPWYRSTPFRSAVVVAFLLALVGLALMVRRGLRARRLQEQMARESLELLVAERTEQLQTANRALEKQAVTDALTELHNRRYLREVLPADLARVRAALAEASLGGALAFFLVDLNLFKQINDSFGHGVGDLVLREVAHRLRSACRDSDTIVRWGGDEFLVVCRRARRAEVAQIAARITKAISDQPLEVDGVDEQQPIALTASLGFCVLPLHLACDLTQEPERSLELADRCLYLAKQAPQGGWCGVVSSSRDAPIAHGESLSLDLDTAGVEIVASDSVRRARRELRRRASDRAPA